MCKLRAKFHCHSAPHAGAAEDMDSSGEAVSRIYPLAPLVSVAAANAVGLGDKTFSLQNRCGHRFDRHNGQIQPNMVRVVHFFLFLFFFVTYSPLILRPTPLVVT